MTLKHYRINRTSFTFKVAATQALQLIVTVSQLPSEHNFSNDTSLDAPPSPTAAPTSLHWPAPTDLNAVRYMATFELEKFEKKKMPRTKSILLYFLSKKEEEITNILKKSGRAGSEVDWGF